MKSETEIIKSLISNFSKSPVHLNEFFHSDSEIIKLGGKEFLISIDSYSDEDYFRLEDPFNFGRNLAVCTISDILACGGRPLVFCNSINVPGNWDDRFLDLLSKGIASVLNECGTAFVGGDFGHSGKWSYTGVVIGESDRTVTRKGAMPGDAIYITGAVGSGNFEAAGGMNLLNASQQKILKDHPVAFPLRLKEASIISKYASSCIDTSDGLLNSLNLISEVNKCGFIIEQVPYFTPGQELLKNMALPQECLMFGECGEYELLFTVRSENENSLRNEAADNKIGIYPIGKITARDSKILIKGEKEIFLNDFEIRAREFDDHKDYLTALLKYLMPKLSLK